MWYLSSGTDKRILYVLPNVDITIGRSVDAQVCNFAIPNDPSISRKHAILSISSNNLFLQDSGSRYGTFIEAQKLEPNVKTKVNNKDVIKFGKMGSVWTVHEINFTTCTSTLKGENLQNLKLCLGKLGAILKNEWDDSCTYLTMPAITLTIKVVLALAQGSQIVTPEYWAKCIEAINKYNALPDPNLFTPHVIESTLNKENVSFLPDERRKSLFSGKTFVFFSKRQMEMYKAVLLKSSASPVLLSETKLTKSSLCENNVVVIQYNLTSGSQQTQAQRDQVTEIVNYIKAKGKRVITDAEIGLALLYCSIEKYCNPGFNFSSEVIKQAPNESAKSVNILAQESQEPNNMQPKKDSVIINETLTPSSHKRKISEDNEVESNANKKLATSVIKSDSNNEGKRKLSDDSNGTSNAKKMAVDNDDDIFNFLRFNKDAENNTTEKKSLFSKPSKRKADAKDAEDDLFNFVPDKRQDTGKEDSTKSSIFDTNRTEKNEEDEIETEVIQKKISMQDEKIDIAALRGAKLKELMEQNVNLNYEGNLKKIKKEDPDDLDQKMQDLDLGTTIVTIRADLIKREPIQIYESENNKNESLKNFKKFKKVWPVKTQINKISRSCLNVESDLTTPQITSQSY